MILEERYEDAVRVRQVHTTSNNPVALSPCWRSCLTQLWTRGPTETLREIILGIVKNKGPSSTSPLSTKIDFVKRSLNKRGISVSDEEI